MTIEKRLRKLYTEREIREKQKKYYFVFSFGEGRRDASVRIRREEKSVLYVNRHTLNTIPPRNRGNVLSQEINSLITLKEKKKINTHISEKNNINGP